ncbi:MAG: hypothetical protein ACK44Z_08040, partial [Pirellulaceae bacterium]
PTGRPSKTALWMQTIRTTDAVARGLPPATIGRQFLVPDLARFLPDRVNPRTAPCPPSSGYHTA